MKSKTTRSFWRAYQNLSSKWQKRSQAAYRTFEEDPSHPGLQFKKVGDNPALYSARVSRDYRALGVLERDTIVWFWIGSHQEYDRLLASWGG